MAGEPGPQAERVAAVAQKIADELDLPLEFEDERLSSQEAKLILREHFLCAREAKLILDAVELFRILYLFRVDIRHGDDLHAVREKLLHGSVCAAAVAEAGDGKCDGCFHGFYPLFLS